MPDPSKAQVRTSLSWQRTSLALGALAALALKLALANHQVIGVITALVALIGAVALYGIARLRFEYDKGPITILLLTSFVIALIGVAAIIQIL